MSQPVTQTAPFVPAPAPKRGLSVGPIIGIIAGVIAVLAGVGSLFLFGKPVLDEAKLQAEIVRITHDKAGLDPTGVTCPKDVPLHAGDVSTCTAQLDGQAISYSVRQTDDKGTVYIESGTFVVAADVEKRLVGNFGQQDLTVTADCAAGKHVVVGGKGTTIPCTVTNTADPSDTTVMTATVTDDQGNVEFN